MPNIPFKKIPGISKLYNDYLIGDPHLQKFFNGHHRNPDDLKRVAEKIIQRNDYQRKFLATVIRETDTEFGITPEMAANLRKLEQNDSLVVISGRQAGMYSGGFYTLLKAISSIKIAEYLSKELNKPVIPIFWVETSDDDINEVNTVSFPGRHNPQKFVYPGIKNPHQQPVGDIKLRKDFTRYAQTIKNILPKNDFYDAVSRLMNETYYPGTTVGKAFMQLMIRLLGSKGLLIIDSENVEIKKLASPVITMKLFEKGRMSELIQQQSDELERENYRDLIKIKSELLNIFIQKDNTQIPLSLLEEVVSSNGEKVVFEDKELIELIDEHPERITAKVAFRPIIQNFLLPTIVYIGGPSEISYFAQLKPVHEYFDLEMPIIWPRASATLIDDRIQRHILRIGIAPEDIFRDYEVVLREIFNRKFPQDFELIVDEAKTRLGELTDWMAVKLTELELPPNDQFQTAVKKMLYQIEYIRHQYFSRLKSRNSALINSWSRIKLQLFPNNILQEREYNVIYFLSRYGFWLMEFLFENLDITDDEHQILEIPARK